jgi:putative transposase
MKGHQWARVLAYVSGLVNQEVLFQVEYLAAENRVLRAHLPDRLRLSNDEHSTLAEIGKRLGRKGLEKVATVARPETILGWVRKLVAHKFDGSTCRSYPGRPATSSEVVNLILRLARENSSWGYDRIAGALINLGRRVSDQTVGNVLRRHGIAPAPKRSQTIAWKDFIASHVAVITGMDFFTVEVLTWRGLITHYVLFMIQLETRRVILAGVTRHPTQEWMEQVARNLADSESGLLAHQSYLLHGRDTKFCLGFQSILLDEGLQPLRLPARSPNLNAFAER